MLTAESPIALTAVQEGGTLHASRITDHVSVPGTKFLKFLRISLCAWVLALAVYQLSETTADPDLWGHVVFGRDMLKAHAIERTETYSWTASGQPFINHEYGADLILGGAHQLLGGTGILLLKLTVGLVAFGLCLRLGTASLSWPGTAVALVFGAVAIVEISFGFAARPQIFTALGLVLVLMVLRRIHAGSRLWALALPPLFIFWINVHGGALAGVGLLLVASVASTMHLISGRMGFAIPGFDGQETPSEAGAPDARTVLTLWLASAGVIGALFCNPWGAALVSWLIKSVLWFRPEIEEWNPAPFGWDHASLFILIAASALAWAVSRRRRAFWELAVCAAFTVLALRSVRNAPLFGLVALALVPAHLSDALARFKDHFGQLLNLWRRPLVQKTAIALLALSAAAIFVSAFTLHKDYPLTMEVPRSRYPTAAAEFIRAHQLQGKLLAFFDWGDFAIFHLPGCPPSIDGRLDACYSRPIITAHWKLYNGQEVDQTVLPLDLADLALLPSNLVGAMTLKDRPGWQAIYFDDTAVVLARDAQRFAGLSGLTLPIQGPKEVTQGRAAFPTDWMAGKHQKHLDAKFNAEGR